MEPLQIMEVDAYTGDGPIDLDKRNPLKPTWFREGWIERHQINPDQSIVIGVRGESMGDAFPHGSKILVDRSRQHRRPGSVYVMMTDDGLVLRRVARTGDEWVLATDGCSETWPDTPWPADADIIGEVKWMSRAVL